MASRRRDDVVDAAARKSTRLVNERRQFRDGVVQRRLPTRIEQQSRGKNTRLLWRRALGAGNELELDVVAAMASARPHEVYASRGCTEAVSRRCRSTQEYNANKKAAAKADAAPAAEAAPKKKRKKLCENQNFTAHSC